ncbi:hypothetical protein FQN50_002546 [Emmonsiellopsis sp. PD_5]|nr:hypothetical protein FQN50_002546 [Emmonsiellopsis sp. PD_5]
MAWTLPNTFTSTSGIVRWTSFGPTSPSPSKKPPIPIVFNHGTPFSSFVWRDIARALATTNTVYLWDMPGYGASEMRYTPRSGDPAGREGKEGEEEQDVSLFAQGRIFADLLKHWGLNNPSTSPNPNDADGSLPLVVAHDFGGAVALRAHLLHNARYRALLLFDPVAVSPWGSPFFKLVRDNAGVFERLPPSLHGALVREYISSATATGLKREVVEGLVGPWLRVDGEGRGVGQQAFYRQIRMAEERATGEVEGLYGGLAGGMRVGVCWGGEDGWIPVERGREFVGLLNGGVEGEGKVQLRVLEGAGHLVQEDVPGQVVGAILGFLRGVEMSEE